MSIASFERYPLLFRMLGGNDGQTLYIVANHYSGSGASDGIVLTQPVDVPHAGRP